MICSFIVVPIIVVVIDSPNIVCRAGSMKQYIDSRYQPIDAAGGGRMQAVPHCQHTSLAVYRHHKTRDPGLSRGVVFVT